MWFLQTFHETVNHWSRLRELAADETGARVSSSSAFACALLRISALNEPVERFLEDVLRGRKNSANWTEGLISALQKLGPLDVLASIDSEIAHPMDSHPTTRTRITALNLSLDESLLSRASRAVVPEENLFFRRYSRPLPAHCLARYLRRLNHCAPRYARKSRQKQHWRQKLKPYGLPHRWPGP